MGCRRQGRRGAVGRFFKTWINKLRWICINHFRWIKPKPNTASTSYRRGSGKWILKINILLQRHAFQPLTACFNTQGAIFQPAVDLWTNNARRGKIYEENFQTLPKNDYIRRRQVGVEFGNWFLKMCQLEKKASKKASVAGRLLYTKK